MTGANIFDLLLGVLLGTVGMIVVAFVALFFLERNK